MNCTAGGLCCFPSNSSFCTRVLCCRGLFVGAFLMLVRLMLFQCHICCYCSECSAADLVGIRSCCCCLLMLFIFPVRDAIAREKWCFFEHCSNGGGGQPMFKNYVGNCRVFWRSFNNMKFAWKGTFEALMVKFWGEIGTLYQIFTPCTPLPKYKRAFTWFLGGSNSLPGCRRIFYRGLP